MLKVEFNTLNNSYPIFKMNDISCFLDTGANIPVWNGSVELFLHKFKEYSPVRTDLVAPISGFGKGTSMMPVYKLVNFILTDGKQTFTFKNLHIAIEENRKRNFDLLLTYSMFKSINIVIKPQKSNRRISFVTGDQVLFNTTIRTDGNEIKYTECYMQEIEIQDAIANYINSLIEQEKDK